MKHKNLILNLYNEYFDSPGDIFISTSDYTDNKAFIISILKNEFSPNFIFSILINNTQLWKDLHFEDWEYILKKVKRPKEKFLKENYGSYCDIIFLNAFIRIDAIDMILNTTNSLIKKKQILNDLYCIADNLYLSSLDLENFKDGTYPNPDLYNKKHEEYLVSGAKESKSESIQIRKYIQKCISEL